MAGGIYADENNAYQIDCTKAEWATNQVNAEYHAAGTCLSDADFAAETDHFIYMIEYKNACIIGASNPEAFNPNDPKNIDKIAHKFYDTLHYMAILKKDKPVKYVYIAEYPLADASNRKSLRIKIAARLPFKLQEGKPRALIENFEVLSIDEWNKHPEYSIFPLTPVQQGAAIV